MVLVTHRVCVKRVKRALTYGTRLGDFGVHIFVFWCNSYLENNLNERPWEVVDEDDLTESRLQERFEMSFPGAWKEKRETRNVSNSFIYTRSYISFICPFLSLSVSSDRSKFRGKRIPPTPAAGRTMTSTAASSGSSSLLCTSMGPFTAPIMLYPA